MVSTQAGQLQNRVRIAARRTDDGLWAYTMLEVVTGEAAAPRIWEYPTALFMEFDADGRDIAAALDECMIVHAGHRLAGPPTAAAKPSGAAGSSGAWSASRSTSAGTSPTAKPNGSRQPCCRRLNACRRSRSPRCSSRRSWPRGASRDDGRAGCVNPAVVPGHRPAAGVELVTHHHQQGLPSTGPTAVGWRRLKRHAQTQLTQVQ